MTPHPMVLYEPFLCCLKLQHLLLSFCWIFLVNLNKSKPTSVLPITHGASASSQSPSVCKKTTEKLLDNPKTDVLLTFTFHFIP